MSLDLWLSSPECPTCKHSESDEGLNYTYNVSPMWYEMFPDDKGDGMVFIDGMTGNQAFLKLNYALSCLAGEPEKFIAMNPSNGWGSYETFKKYIIDLIEQCHKHPDWIWESCR